jgi:hypothetical protein
LPDPAENGADPQPCWLGGRALLMCHLFVRQAAA